MIEVLCDKKLKNKNKRGRKKKKKKRDRLKTDFLAKVNKDIGQKEGINRRGQHTKRMRSA